MADINLRLVWAVRDGRVEEVRDLIDSYGLSYSPAWSGGYRLLCEGLRCRQVAVAELLLSRGAEINSNSSEPADTPLHLAARSGFIEIVRLLLDKSADVYSKDPAGRTPLHEAIFYQNIEVVELLLSRHANVNTADNRGRTPIYDAVRIGNLLIVKTLLKHGAEVNNCVDTSYFNGGGCAPLHFAVQSGNKDVVSLLLSRGADVDAKMEGGVTPLHVAAGEGKTHIAEELLNHGASTQSVTCGRMFKGRCVLSEGHMPLHSAVESGWMEVVNLFLDRGADISARTASKSTPLHIAIKRSRDEIASVLLKRGAKVDDQDGDGKTALQLAVEGGSLVVVKMVLQYCPDINDISNRTSLKTAVMRDVARYRDIVESLRKYGLNVECEDTNDPELLHGAVRRGYLKIVEGLLKFGADVNTLDSSVCGKGFTPLHCAAKNKQVGVAKLLLSHKADVHARCEAGKTPVFYAVQNSDVEITKLLLDNGADVKINSELLCIAVEKGSFEMVEFLLQRGADVNTRDDFGRTPLHCFFPIPSDLEYYDDDDDADNVDEDDDVDDYDPSSAERSVMGSIARLLLSQGAFVDARNKKGWTTLHLASYFGSTEVVEVLLVRRANVNAKLEDGRTALHMASQKGHKLVVKLLLEYGAKADAKLINTGDTPLHLAANWGGVRIVEPLLECGVDVDVKNGKGLTPLNVAVISGCILLVETLLEGGADINIMNVANGVPNCVYGVDDLRRQYGYSQNSDSEDDFYFEHIFPVLKRHIVKLNTASLYLSDHNLQSIKRLDYDEFNLQQRCEEEIARVMEEKIGGTTISFYDILSKSSSSLEIYLRNESILQAVLADDYNTKFPLYGRMIKSNVRKGLERKELLLRGSNFFHFLSSTLPELPHECTEKIFSYLNNADLKYLIEAFQPLLIYLERKELLDECSKIFCHLPHLPELPNACTSKIFSYLSNEDVRVLVELCRPVIAINP